MASVGGVDLSDSATVWTDEFDWTPVSQTIDVDLTGGLVVEYAHTENGRPVTLSVGWVDRTTLAALEALRDAETQDVLPVELPGGRVIDAIFNHNDGPLAVSPVIERPEYNSDDRFDVTIHLLQVV